MGRKLPAHHEIKAKAQKTSFNTRLGSFRISRILPLIHPFFSVKNAVFGPLLSRTRTKLQIGGESISRGL
jgi:hypothetical protein